MIVCIFFLYDAFCAFAKCVVAGMNLMSIKTICEGLCAQNPAVFEPNFDRLL